MDRLIFLVLQDSFAQAFLNEDWPIFKDKATHIAFIVQQAFYISISYLIL